MLFRPIAICRLAGGLRLPGLSGQAGGRRSDEPLPDRARDGATRVLDRLDLRPSPVRTDPTIEGWTLLTFLAAAFPRFRYGHLVLSQSYRNPALLAKMAASLQELTGGRFILGLGAGWHEEEYRAYGFEYPSGGVRVAQLAEAIQIIRAVWTQSPATYHGTYYHVDGLICEPMPDPPIPIMIGTEGPKALAVTARLADMWNWDGPWEAVYRAAVSRRFAAIASRSADHSTRSA